MSLDSVRADTLVYFTSKFVASTTASLGSVPDIIAPNMEEPNQYPFIKFTFVESESHNAALDYKLRRYIGFVQVDILVDANSGSRTSNIIAQAIKDILENVELNVSQTECIVYSTGRTQEADSGKGKYRQVVRIPYRRDVLA
jgi:hypothetical protein